jgi:hypothetical protein
MNVQVTARPTIQPAASSKLAIADGDIHPQRNSYKDLFPGVSGGAGVSEGPAERLAP